MEDHTSGDELRMGRLWSMDRNVYRLGRALDRLHLAICTGKMERYSGDLKIPPQPFKGVELPKFLAHQVNDDISAVDKFPPVSGRLLLAVCNDDTPFIEEIPDIVDDSPKMSDAVDRGDDEAIRPRSSTLKVDHMDITAAVVFKIRDNCLSIA